MTNRKSIVYLGSNGFPYGLADIQKIILISKSLILTGNHVTVICTSGFHDKKQYPELKVHGNFEDIEYVYTSGTPFRNEHFIKRNFLKIKGIIDEIFFLKKRKKNNTLDYAIISTEHFYVVLFSVILSKVFGFKTILNYVEYRSRIKKKWFKIGKQFNDKLLDKYAPLLVDGVLPISEFLISHLKTISPDKKFLKIPGLTDFEKFNDIEILKKNEYFLFCGAANYKEIIQFIIDSFVRLNRTPVFLYLVINGSDADITEIKKYISNQPQKENIQLFSRLSEKQLYTLYKNAIALLIPLRPTFQDIARFPHKTGEYLASENPVISTNYGEIKYYFKDMENMLLADSYDINLFADKMQFVIDNPDLAKEIGIKGKDAGKVLFDYRIKASVINNFLDCIN
jgi:glycosyltransferase involved in cell wall biosynthesis